MNNTITRLYPKPLSPEGLERLTADMEKMFGPSKELAFVGLPALTIEELARAREDLRRPENEDFRKAIAELRLAEYAAAPEVAAQIRGGIERLRKAWRKP